MGAPKSRQDRTVKLSNLRLGFPILRLRIQVDYRLTRQPTAWEKIVLRLAQDLSTTSPWNSVPLQQLFSDLLGVHNPAPLLEEILREMEVSNMVRLHGGIPLEQITLSHVEITEVGRQLLAGADANWRFQTVEASVDYDPIQQTIVACGTEADLPPRTQEPPAAALPAEIFAHVNPTAQMAPEVVRQQAARFEGNPEIRSAREVERRVLWEEQAVALSLSGDRLAFQTGKDTHQQYLNGMPGRDLYDHILVPVSRELIFMRSNAPANGDDGQQVYFAIEQTPEQVVNKIVRDKFVVVNARADWQNVPQSAAEGQVIVIIDPDAHDEPSVRWNTFNTGCIVTVRENAGDLVIANRRSTLRTMPLDCQVGGDRYSCEVPFLVLDPQTGARDRYGELLDALTSHLLDHGGATGMLIHLAWQRDEDFWRFAASHFLTKSATVYQAIQDFLDLLQAAREAEKMPPMDLQMQILSEIVDEAARQEKCDWRQNAQETMISLVRIYRRYYGEQLSDILVRLNRYIPDDVMDRLDSLLGS